MLTEPFAGYYFITSWRDRGGEYTGQTGLQETTPFFLTVQQKHCLKTHRLLHDIYLPVAIGKSQILFRQCSSSVIPYTGDLI